MLGMEQVYVRYGIRWLAAILVGVLFAVFAGHGIVYADGATIVVNSYGDAKAKDGLCTLREAVISANSNKSRDEEGECAPGTGDDTILLPPGTYSLSRSNNGGENASTTGDLDFASNVTLAPASPGLVVIKASGISDRVFHIISNTTTIMGVTITGGTASGDGGGVLVNAGAMLYMVNVTLTGNAAQQGSGGGLFVEGAAELTNVTIAGNVADDGVGVAESGSLVLRNSVVAGDSCHGYVTATGANLFYSAEGCPAGTVNGDPLLDPFILQDYFTLQAGSPAIGEGLDGCPAVDQMGKARNTPLGCDLGADEYPFDAPQAKADAYTTYEDVPLSVVAPGVLGNDGPGSELTAIHDSGPSHGSLALHADGSFVYTPNANFNGVDSFTYRANDNEVDSNETTVTITVQPENDAPQAVSDGYGANEDAALNVPAPGVLANDSDSENDQLSAVLASGPRFGDLILNGDGSFSYLPYNNFFGKDSFTYTANDATRASAPAPVTIDVASDGIIEVNTTDDGDDGMCDWQHCSLREAIALANSPSAADQIVFDIPDSDPGLNGTLYVIVLHSALPPITSPVVIDGTTQPGGQIVVDGDNGDFHGFVLIGTAGGSTIRGLVIRNFSGDGIRIEGSPNNVVGTGGNTITGNTITGNGGNGITVIDSANNRITGNDISDNGGLPIDLGNDGPTDNDPGDSDVGANFVQNHPDLIRAVGIAAQSGADPDTLQIVGTLNSQAGAYAVEFFISPTCDTGGQSLLNPEPLAVIIAADATETGFAANIGVEGDVAELLGYGVRAIATDADGNSSEENNCIHVSYGNDTWVNSFEQTSQLTDQASLQSSSVDDTSTTSFSISQYLDTLGQSRWYKLKVSANSKVKFDLTNLPADYNLAVYKDVEEAYLELTDGVQDLNKLGAEVASDPLNPSASTADAFRTAQTAGSALNGSALNGSALNGSALNGSALNGSALNGSALNGSALNGSALNGSALNGSALNALALNGSALNGSALNGSALNAEELARVQSSALARTLIAVSAAEGTSPESVEINTWNNAGDIYVRVWGTEGTFDTDSPFTLTTTLTPGLCEAVTADQLPATSLGATAGGYETLILADWSRLYDADLTGYAFDQSLADRLAALNAEVGGVVVDVGQDARVAAANALADAHADCSYGKNLVAESIQAIVDDYRTQNPVKYVVIVGNDDIIPFYRYPDNALLGPEAQYFVPNRFGTPSYSALRQNYVLTQDQYGSDQCISLKDNCFPIPQIPVGRLVESPVDMTAVLDAYLNGGEVLTPHAALVTGYDFLEDAALEIRDELATGVVTVDGDLIDPQKPGPLALAEQGLAWTASDLIDKLQYDPTDPADIDYDLYFLAGHFSSASALAGDYKTTVLTTDLPSDMTDKLVYSAGCHVSYNSVDWQNIPGTTVEPDWAQALASRGATLIGGTGYQYGDTDILEFSERLYLYFTEELGKQLDGAGQDVRDVAIGDALVAAKQRYISETPLLRGIHEKTLLISTIYGLPMLKVDLPSRPVATTEDSSVVKNGDLSAVPGNELGLRSATVSHVPDLQFQEKELRSVDDPDTVIHSGYWVGDGVVANPGEPLVPVERLNVTPPSDSLALRGVALTGACYNDELLTDRIPLTGAPATEASAAHIQFYSDRYTPEQVWSENYFGALFDPTSNSSTFVDVMPVQYRSDVNSLPEFVYSERKFSKMELRLYYNDAMTTDPAHLAPAPAIVRVISAYDQSAGADFDVTVAADAMSGTQSVWVLWTDLLDSDNVALGCEPGEKRWNELPLVQNPADASLWSANLDLGLSPTEVADRIRFIVFAVGKAGAVSWATNQGPFYAIGANATRGLTSLTLDTLQSTSGPVGTTMTANATLMDDQGAPLVDRSIVFGLAQQTRIGVTGSDGRATVELPIFGIPGEHDITASFPGSSIYAPSTAAPQSFVVAQQSSALKLAPGSNDPDEDAVFVATLVDGVSPDPNILVEQTVFFHFTDANGATVIRTAITGLFGEARLGRNGIVDGIGEGAYTVVAEFKGSPSYSSSESNALLYQQGQSPAPPAEQRLFLPSISSIRDSLGESNGTPSGGEVVQLPFVTGK